MQRNGSGQKTSKFAIRSITTFCGPPEYTAGQIDNVLEKGRAFLRTKSVRPWILAGIPGTKNHKTVQKAKLSHLRQGYISGGVPGGLM